ncbi:MAG: hypothetical protein DHS20C18_50250 [Saprospiraceae bacterium]|nr:MAG: hypothetical protein DHS20C18_50250 [Saprospiraceae bacterium]
MMALLFIGQSFTTITPEHIDLGRWEKLGQRNVNYGLDRDEVYVTAREGRFTAIKLGVKRSGINMHRCVVHFRNGSSQEIDIRENIPAGGTTRVIDLTGPKRIISKVVFWYDTKNIAARKGVVALWGRH